MPAASACTSTAPPTDPLKTPKGYRALALWVLTGSLALAALLSGTLLSTRGEISICMFGDICTPKTQGILYVSVRACVSACMRCAIVLRSIFVPVLIVLLVFVAATIWRA